MDEPKEQFEQLLQHMRDQTGHDFPVNGNACTLVNHNDEIAVVIEQPENSDLLLLHRMLAPLPSDPDARNGRALQLLVLNSRPEKLQGTWFCIDSEGGGIHLMSGQPIHSLTPDNFENLLFNYVELANTLALEIAEEEQDLALVSKPPVSWLQP